MDVIRERRIPEARVISTGTLCHEEKKVVNYTRDFVLQIN